MREYIIKSVLAGTFTVYFIFSSNAQLNSVSHSSRLLIDAVSDLEIDKSEVYTIKKFKLLLNNEVILQGTNPFDLLKVVDLPPLGQISFNQPMDLRLIAEYDGEKQKVFKKFVTYNEIYGVQLVFPTSELL